MGIGVSLLSFALGAIFAFAVRNGPGSLDLHAVGVVLMVVGVIGFATSLYFERWRQRVIEESIETGNVANPVEVDGVVIDPTPHSVVREHEVVVPERHPRQTTHPDALVYDEPALDDTADRRGHAPS
jgi:hypothetical protein